MAEESLLDVFIYETTQDVEKLEDIMISAEKHNVLSIDEINEVFRVMHTIKGSSAMMTFDNISKPAHALEDLFSILRENNKSADKAQWTVIFDLVLRAIDFIKNEIDQIKAGKPTSGNEKPLVADIKNFIDTLSQKPKKGKSKVSDKTSGGKDLSEDDLTNLTVYKIDIFFTPDCQMENVRSFGVVNELSKLCKKILTEPSDLNDEGINEYIQQNGLTLFVFTDKNGAEINDTIAGTLFLKSFELRAVTDDSQVPEEVADILKMKQGIEQKNSSAQDTAAEASSQNSQSSFISVSSDKLDKLLNLVGEIVIAESMILQNPDLKGLVLENFDKSARQLRKLTNELQDVVMSVRMVPIASTFHKMQRIIRDMSKKTGKDVELTLIGEETEIDKNIIDHLSNPLMHIIRNSVDHGIEEESERIAAGKDKKGRVVLEAASSGSDIVITVTDDGRGLDRDKILKKAAQKGLLTKPEAEVTDKEAFSMILLPSFSTKENVTEFSGRGVGLDVVKSGLDALGGSISINSKFGEGTTLTLKIPLTLAIINGMEVTVGGNGFIIPITNIRESFKVKKSDIVLDPDGNEVVIIRGNAYSVVRLHQIFDIATEITNIEDGILIMIESSEKKCCVFADKLVAEQQVVAKGLPTYISKLKGSIHGISGCSMLGDGRINLILDTSELCG